MSFDVWLDDSRCFGVWSVWYLDDNVQYGPSLLSCTSDSYLVVFDFATRFVCPRRPFKLPRISRVWYSFTAVGCANLWVVDEPLPMVLYFLCIA